MKRKSTAWFPIVAIAALVLTPFLFAWRSAPQENIADVSYTRFKELVVQGEVIEVTFFGNKIEAQLRRPLAFGDPARELERVRSNIPEIGDPSLLPGLEERSISIASVPSRTEGPSSLAV